MHNKASPTLARTPMGMPRQGGNLPKANTDMPKIKNSGVPHGGPSKASPTLARSHMGGVTFGGFKRGVV